ERWGRLDLREGALRPLADECHPDDAKHDPEDYREQHEDPRPRVRPMAGIERMCVSNGRKIERAFYMVKSCRLPLPGRLHALVGFQRQWFVQQERAHEFPILGGLILLDDVPGPVDRYLAGARE